MQRDENYMEVMSLRAWSSSSLMALYFSFWEYNSSIVGGGGGTGEGKGEAGTAEESKEGEGRRKEERRWSIRAIQRTEGEDRKTTC